MLVTGFPAGVFAANCYLVAPAPGEECVIIDPGQDAERGIEELLGRYRLKPIAVLLTHGHVDHMFSVAPVCGAKGIPAYIHPGDADRLGDPLGPWAGPAAGNLFPGVTFTEPDDVRQHEDGQVITLGGVDFAITHAPGHTQGSVTYRSTETDLDALFTGDLLFAGSIGRTDLPGGDHAAILDSLSRTLTLPDEVVVLPGHGPRTTIGDERQTNPFLSGLKPAQKGM